MESRESAVLLAALDAQREHVLGILEGLPEEALHRPVLPSGWTCLGLVRHLALDVERFWFRAAFAGEEIEPGQAGDPDEASDDAWQVPPEMPGAVVLDLYRQEIARANAFIAAMSLDSGPASWPEEIFPNWRMTDLREAIVHVITETACHAGHLDAVRELIDGRSWLVLT
jgi:uncharacterized damage-inducible protein DinB